MLAIPVLVEVGVISTMVCTIRPKTVTTTIPEVLAMASVSVYRFINKAPPANQDNLWKITNLKVKYSKDGGINFFDGAISKTTEQDILLSTGASNEFKMINIYDIAGNVWEWTLKSNNNCNYPRTFRGGGFNIESIDGTACRRSSVSTDSIFDVGFRVSIY